MKQGLKVYYSDRKGKEEFVNELLSNLIYQANTGWGGCRYYEALNGEEYVILIALDGEECNKICVTADSCEAIVRDVFKNL